jgi:hypothetical protein
MSSSVSSKEIKGDLDAERIKAKATTIAELDNQIKGSEKELRRVSKTRRKLLALRRSLPDATAALRYSNARSSAGSAAGRSRR